jgi:hypothetical protein
MTSLFEGALSCLRRTYGNAACFRRGISLLWFKTA